MTTKVLNDEIEIAFTANCAEAWRVFKADNLAANRLEDEDIRKDNHAAHSAAMRRAYIVRADAYKAIEGMPEAE